MELNVHSVGAEVEPLIQDYESYLIVIIDSVNVDVNKDVMTLNEKCSQVDNNTSDAHFKSLFLIFFIENMIFSKVVITSEWLVRATCKTEKSYFGTFYGVNCWNLISKSYILLTPIEIYFNNRIGILRFF